VADGDVAERARRYVAVERLDRATELARRLGHSAQPIRWTEARLALAFLLFRIVRMRTLCCFGALFVFRQHRVEFSKLGL
jgi:hypothetical protein